jgi:Lrp/AsnC family transcriptional regulator for asnA, asnC and gidA
MAIETGITLDELDRSLIVLLQENARTSYQELGEILGVSASTARRRTERLLDARAVKAVVVPHWRQLGYDFMALVGISVELSKLRQVGRGLAAMEEVNWLAMTTGSYDLFAQIVLPRNEDITRFITERVAPIEGIRHMETLMVPEWVKSFEEYRLPREPDPLYTTAPGRSLLTFAGLALENGRDGHGQD